MKKITKTKELAGCMYLIKLYKNNVSQLHSFAVKLRFDIKVQGFKVKTTKILPLRLGLGGRPLGLGRRPLGLGGRPLGLGRRRGPFSSSAFDAKSSVKKNEL